MNPGSHAFAADIDDTPASRSSLTIRSCNVPNARSMRPFAWGLLAQMMSMFNANSARPNWVTPSPPAASLLFTRTMPTVLPQPVRDHPTAQGLARDRTAVMLCQLLRRQSRAEVGVPLAHDRQRQGANLSG